MTNELLSKKMDVLGMAISPESLINVQVFKASGTYTPTAGMANCIIQLSTADAGSGTFSYTITK